MLALLNAKANIFEDRAPVAAPGVNAEIEDGLHGEIRECAPSFDAIPDAERSERRELPFFIDGGAPYKERIRAIIVEITFGDELDIRALIASLEPAAGMVRHDRIAVPHLARIEAERGEDADGLVFALWIELEWDARRARLFRDWAGRGREAAFTHDPLLIFKARIKIALGELMEELEV